MSRQGIENYLKIAGKPGIEKIQANFNKNLARRIEQIQNGQVEMPKPNDPDDIGYGGPFQKEEEK